MVIRTVDMVLWHPTAPACNRRYRGRPLLCGQSKVRLSPDNSENSLASRRPFISAMRNVHIASAASFHRLPLCPRIHCSRVPKPLTRSNSVHKSRFARLRHGRVLWGAFLKAW